MNSRHRPPTSCSASCPTATSTSGSPSSRRILFAAGLSLQGAKAVAAIYSTFLQRAFDQIVHDVCLQNLNVVFAMDRAGLVGDDGPTHHGVFDIAYLRPLPNMTLMAPRDEAMLVRMLRTALVHDGPIALRYPRGNGTGVPLPAEPQPLKIGTGEILREAESGAARRVAPARLRHRASARRWRRPTSSVEHGIAVTVADARFAKTGRRRARRPARVRARPAGHRRGGRARRRLRLRGLGDPLRSGDDPADPARRAAGQVRDPRLAGRSSRRRSASPGSGSPSGSRPRSPSRAPSRSPVLSVVRARRKACAAATVSPRERCAGSGSTSCSTSAECSPRAPRAAASVLAGEGPRWELRGAGSTSPGSSWPRTPRSCSPDAPAYVSRGGIKLAQCPGSPRHRRRRDARALDVGASTGGFTDCLLQRGATQVAGGRRRLRLELDWKLRTDPRVTVIERTNARSLAPGQLPFAADTIVIDVLVHLAHQGACSRAQLRRGAL